MVVVVLVVLEGMQRDGIGREKEAGNMSWLYSAEPRAAWAVGPTADAVRYWWIKFLQSQKTQV
jgi:hypothetical protein